MFGHFRFASLLRRWYMDSFGKNISTYCCTMIQAFGGTCVMKLAWERYIYTARIRFSRSYSWSLAYATHLSDAYTVTYETGHHVLCFVLWSGIVSKMSPIFWGSGKSFNDSGHTFVQNSIRAILTWKFRYWKSRNQQPNTRLWKQILYVVNRHRSWWKKIKQKPKQNGTGLWGCWTTNIGHIWLADTPF